MKKYNEPGCYIDYDTGLLEASSLAVAMAQAWGYEAATQPDSERWEEVHLDEADDAVRFLNEVAVDEGLVFVWEYGDLLLMEVE